MGKASRRKRSARRDSGPGKRKPKSDTKTDILYGRAVHVLLIIVLGFLVYSNTFDVPFHFDDVPNIEHNPIIKDLRHFSNPSAAERFELYNAFKSRFVGYLTFALNYGRYGLDVAGYHVFNLAVHVINALLVYALVVVTFQTPLLRNAASALTRPNSVRLTALFAALLFVSHPVQTQAVTYIVQRLSSLTTMFYLLSTEMYIRSRLSAQRAPRSMSYVAALIFAAAAMKTKEIAFTLPIMIALYEFMFLDGKVKRRVLLLIPLFPTMLIIPLTILGVDVTAGEIIGDVGKATRIQTDVSRWDYLLTQFSVIATYVRLLFFPVNQNLDYDYPISHSFVDPGVFSSFFFLVLIFCAGVFSVYRYKAANTAGRSVSPYPMLISFGIFWFFGTLSVESSIIPIVDVIFEHRVYLPSAGAFLAIAASALFAADKLVRRRKRVEKTVIAAAALSLIVLSAGAYMRNTVWHSEITLWEDVVRKSPGKARGYYNTGIEYNESGMEDKAIEAYKKAIELKDDYADAYYNLGLVYYDLERDVEAMNCFNRAVENSPNFSKAYYNMGHIKYKRGLYKDAVKYFEKTVEKKPDYADAFNMLGLSYWRLKQYASALESFDKAIAEDPASYKAHNNKGMVYAETGDYSSAVKEFGSAIRKSPSCGEAYENRGIVYLMLKRGDSAGKDFLKACLLGIERACARAGRK